MAFDLDNLLHCLRLQATEPGVVQAENLDLGYHRIFGGQILAQMIMSAAGACPDKSVKSIHVLFPREGDTDKTLAYRVDVKQAGRTFATISIVASQDDKVVAVATASMHSDEDGLHRCDAAPEVGPPQRATPRAVGIIPWEVRIVDDADLSDPRVGPPSYQFWMRAESLGHTAHDGRAVHQALMAHATDLTLIGTALRPFDGVSQAQSTHTLHTAVTSHSLWFHQPFRLDEWLLVAQHSPVVAHGRAFGRGDVFTEAGDLVASFAQESMIRAL